MTNVQYTSQHIVWIATDRPIFGTDLFIKHIRITEARHPGMSSSALSDADVINSELNEVLNE